jgi:hypothetical protein
VATKKRSSSRPAAKTATRSAPRGRCGKVGEAFSRSIWKDGFARIPPSRGDPCRRALRPIEASKAEVCNGLYVDSGPLATRADRWDDRFSTRNWSSQPPVRRSRISHSIRRAHFQVCSPAKSSTIYPTDPRIRAKGEREGHASVGPRVDCHSDRRANCRMAGGQDCPRQRVWARRRLGDRHHRRARRRLASASTRGFILAPVSSGLRSTPQSERFCYCSLCVSLERADGEVDSRAVRSNCVSLVGLDDRSTSKPVKLIGF